ncbi:biotin--[acetyl-CoA-carboxylase] ligase [Novosphingobium sp. RD2P27]|uniref:biotin--[biotin carboxyl-carrier protein] ligase n=1 Tax=Novosphingobium kalidii TaxID=3230299 RepID=A0ABV2D2X0_9SPHN
MIEVVAETGSTSADLTGRLSAGEAVDDGHWLVADRQTAGRGRQGRTWSDGAGNFMGSTLVRLRAGDPPAHTLSLVAGVAVLKALECSAPAVAGLLLKWPNDVLVNGAKLAGILLERTGDAVIVGIGVNLAQAPEVSGRAVASLAALECVVERDAFAAMLDTCWGESLGLWRCGGWAEVRRGWLARAHPIGTPLAVHGANGEMVHGTFAGIDNEGALQLQLAGGTRRTIHAGEVLLDRR